MAEHEDGPNDLRTPFVFVPHGAPEPAELISTLGEVLRIPATLRPDPPPRSLHPHAALPTGTPATRAPAGTPAALGALVSGRRQHTRFPRSKYPPRMNQSHEHSDPVTEYLRSSQMMDAAARAYAAPETAPATSFRSTASILEAADEVTSQAHAAIRLLQQHASSPILLASEKPPEEVRPEGRPLSPQHEINSDE